MAVPLIGGVSGAVADVDPTFDALRVSQRPPEAVGAFRIGEFTGLLAPGVAANAYVFFIRNPDPAKLVVLQYLKVRAVVVTGFTAAQELGFDAIHGRTWTSATAGGTAISVANNNLKKRTGLSPSVVDARISAAAALTAPTTVTLDANPFMAGMGKTLAAAATVQDAAFEEEFDATNGSDYPIIYGQNEGLLIRNKIVLGAGGTLRLAITAAWLEVLGY